MYRVYQQKKSKYRIMMFLYLGRTGCVTVAMTGKLPQLRALFEGRDIFPPILFRCFFRLFLRQCLLYSIKTTPYCVSPCERRTFLKGPSRHKMASDSPTQSLLSYTHTYIHVYMHTVSHTLSTVGSPS